MGAYSIQKVRFESHGLEVIGRLFIPEANPPHPAVVILGPVAFVKEQSPLQYATRLAGEGFAALVFDPRYHGESAGEPRRYESGKTKVEDLGAALDFLGTHPALNPRRLYLLGVCQGVNWALEATTLDPRVEALALVAGHYLMPQTAAMYLGGPEKAEERLRRGEAARARFEQTGEAEYIPIIGSPEALLLSPAIAHWYAPWADHSPMFAYRGRWENRITALSEAEIWGYRVNQTAQKLTRPTLMLHADRAASGPEIPRRLFECIPARDKRLIWLGDQTQFQFYDDPLTLDLATRHVADWFRRWK